MEKLIVNKKEVYALGCKLYYHLYALFHPMEKKVVFSSFFGKQYSDNPRAISEKLHVMYPDYKIVWIMPKDKKDLEYIPDYITVINKNNKGHQELKQISTACAYVYNCELKNNITKRKNQLFIQTWHGDLPFKKVLYDANPNLHKTDRIMDNMYTDLCIAGCELGENQYRTAFKYTGKILNIGTPRNDKLITNSKIDIDRIKKRIGIGEDKKVLIFAPTFRDNQKGRQIINVDLHKVISHLEKKGSEWVCLVRSHIASQGIEFSNDGIKFIDVTNYPDMADILLVGDLLITDYSSCAGDFIRKNGGVILTIFDKEEYAMNCREFVLDLNTSGFITAENMEELIHIVDKYSEEDYVKNCKELCKLYKINESGHSSETICDIINQNYIESARKNE